MRARILIATLLAAPALVSVGYSGAVADERRYTLSGTVFLDADANGRTDQRERNVRDIEITLEGKDDHQGYKETRKTDEKGAYEFTRLLAGRYSIMVKLPEMHGLSTGGSINGKDIELDIDGRATRLKLDFGLARLEQLPTPVPVPTQTPLPTQTPVPTQTPIPVPTQVTHFVPPVYVVPPPPPARVAPPPAPPPTQTPVPTPTPLPPPTVAPFVAPPPQPPPTLAPTPTSTPPPMEDQYAGAERARKAVDSSGQVRTGSSRVDGDVLLDVPFRTAQDGSDYADTNSGSASVGMAMEAYGFAVSTADLRSLANTLGRTYDVGQSPRLELLVRVAELPGLRGVGLQEGARLAVWSPQEVRERLKQGYPVLTQLRPDEAGPDGERFILVIGWKNGEFLYHDPTYPDERGAARTILPVALSRAWANGPTPAQAAAFALGRAELGLFASPEKLALAQRQPDTFSEATPTPPPAATPEQSLAERAQLIPVRATEEPTSILVEPMRTPWGWPLPAHPLLLAFGAVAGAVLIRVVAGLVLD